MRHDPVYILHAKIITFDYHLTSCNRLARRVKNHSLPVHVRVVAAVNTQITGVTSICYQKDVHDLYRIRCDSSETITAAAPSPNNIEMGAA